MAEKRKRTLAERRRRIRYSVGGVLLFLGVVSLAGVAYMVRLPGVTLSQFTVNGHTRIMPGEVEEIVKAELVGSYGWLIPRRSTLFYPRAEIEEALTQQLLLVRAASVRREGLTALAISLEEREAHAWWCSGHASSSYCFLLDEGGLLFEEVNPGDEAMVIYRGGDTQKLGEVFLKGAFRALDDLIHSLPEATLRTPESVMVDAHNDVFVQFKEGGELRFTLSAEPHLLLENIASVFSSKSFEGGAVFEYVDFRFGKKVYIQFLTGTAP